MEWYYDDLDWPLNASRRFVSVTVQIVYSFVTSGLPDQARPRHVMVKRSHSVDRAKSYLSTGLEHGVAADAEAQSRRSWNC